MQELSHECGELYSKTLVFFWRTVRHKGIWLQPKLLMRLFTSPKLHAHTSDACVQAFSAALASYALGAPLMPEEKEEPDVQARRAEQSAGIDLGEIHAAVAHDGHHTHIMNGRLLRSKRQFQNKLKAELDSRIARKKQGSKRRKKQKQLRKVKHPRRERGGL